MCVYLLHEHIISVSSGSYNKTGWFKQCYISQLWRLESSKTRLQADLTLGEDTFHLVEGFFFTISSHGRQRALMFLPFFIKAFIP